MSVASKGKGLKAINCIAPDFIHPGGRVGREERGDSAHKVHKNERGLCSYKREVLAGE